MAIDRVEVGERGLVALKNIRKREKLLFFPPSLVVTPDSEWSCPEAGEVLKRYSVPDWPLIATYLTSEVINIDTFRWSFGILYSRLVLVPSLDGRVALVPWADMLNHSCEVETYLDYDKSSKGIVFTTDRAYEPGEQVFISYGKKSNGELLLSHGFVPKEGTNPSNSVELSLSLKRSDEWKRNHKEDFWWKIFKERSDIR